MLFILVQLFFRGIDSFPSKNPFTSSWCHCPSFLPKSFLLIHFNIVPCCYHLFALPHLFYFCDSFFPSLYYRSCLFCEPLQCVAPFCSVLRFTAWTFTSDHLYLDDPNQRLKVTLFCSLYSLVFKAIYGGKRKVLLNVQSSHHHSADIPNVWHSYFLLRLSN